MERRRETCGRNSLQIFELTPDVELLCYCDIIFLIAKLNLNKIPVVNSLKLTFLVERKHKLRLSTGVPNIGMEMQRIGPEQLKELAPVGHYVALRIGFAFPVEEINALPSEWVDHYIKNSFMLFDPVIRWAYSKVGALRWSEIDVEDPRRIIAQAQTFGLRYGAAISVFDGNAEGQRSFASFVRADRDYTDLEMNLLHAYVKRLHLEMVPPTNLTMAELEALGMVRHGKRLKEIAYELGVTEGAVKQRLKNAKVKLGAKTGTQAAALASQYGLI